MPFLVLTQMLPKTDLATNKTSFTPFSKIVVNASLIRYYKPIREHEEHSFVAMVGDNSGFYVEESCEDIDEVIESFYSYSKKEDV